MATKEQVDIIIKATTDQATRNIDALNKSINKNSESMKKSQSSAETFKASWVKVAAAAASAAVVINKGFDLAETAAKFRQSSDAMANQFGVNADSMIAKLSEVSAGTISNRDLVLSANRAMALNVTRDQGQIAKLLEFARLRARAMGTDTTDAFNDIVIGIGRGSPLILDNLGLITKGWNKEAESAGYAFDSQFILNKVLNQAGTELKKVGDLTETSAERFQRFRTDITNAANDIGEILIPAATFFMDAIDNFVFVGRNFSKVWDFMVQAGIVAMEKIGLDVIKGFAFLINENVRFINNYIRLVNKLPGVHFKQLDLVLQKQISINSQIVENEELKLAELGIMLQESADKRVSTEEAVQVKLNKKREKEKEKTIKTWQEIAQQRLSVMSSVMGQISAIVTQYFTNENMRLDNLKKKRFKQLDERFKKEKDVANLTADELAKIEKRQAEEREALEEEFAAKQRKLARKQAKIQKAASIAQATINVAQGITMAMAQSGLFFAAAAAVMAAAGAAQIGLIAAQPLPEAQEGALIRGSAQGTALIAGERNKTEAIIPLENEEAMRKLGGMGSTINITFNTETMIADEEFPRAIADKIDQALYELKQEGQSRIL